MEQLVTTNKSAHVLKKLPIQNWLRVGNQPLLSFSLLKSSLNFNETPVTSLILSTSRFNRQKISLNVIYFFIKKRIT